MLKNILTTKSKKVRSSKKKKKKAPPKRVNIRYNISRANQINNYTITDFCNNIDLCDENLADKLEAYNEEITHIFNIRDRIKRMVSYLNLKLWLFITVVATMAAWTGIGLSLVIGKYSKLKIQMIKEYSKQAGDYYFYAKFGLYTGSMITLGLISVLICQMISPMATGSGVPQVKTVLSGVRLFKFLEKKVLFAKIFALFFSAVSGVGTGKEGPLIHISAMYAYNLSRLPIAKSIGTNPYARQQVMTVAVAAGVTSTFGAPFAGILFSAELCSTVFLLSNFWKLFVCGSIVKLWYELGLNYFDALSPITSKKVHQSQVITNIPHYILIGVICGWLCSLWIYSFSLFLQWKSQTKNRIIKNPYLYTFFALFIIGLLNFNLSTGYVGNGGLVSGLWTEDYLPNKTSLGIGKNSVFRDLLLTYLIRFACIMLFATCPFPNGVSFPSITQGALLGRIYGEVLRWYNPSTQVQSFSMIGAAAYAGVMTRTVSVAFLVIDITGQTSLTLGVLTAAMCAYAIANVFTMSAFNTVLSIKNMPYLPFMFSSTQYKNIAGEYCEDIVDYFTESTTVLDLLKVYLNKKRLILEEFLPVVDNESDMKLLGSVRTLDMLLFIRKVCGNIETELKDKLKQKGKEKGTPQQDDDISIDMLKKLSEVPYNLRLILDELKRTEYLLNLTPKGIGLERTTGQEKTVLRKKFEEAINQIEINQMKMEEGEEEIKEDLGNEIYLFLRQFLLNIEVEWENPEVIFNSYPIVVDYSAKFIKVHYLFQMLGVDSMFVADRGKLTGRMRLETFLNSKYGKR